MRLSFPLLNPEKCGLKELTEKRISSILMVEWLKQKKIRSLFWQRVRNRSAVNHYFRKALIIIVIMLIPGQLSVYAQTNTITFHSGDSLALTADVYLEADTLPFLVMIHEQGSSRGEFEKIA